MNTNVADLASLLAEATVMQASLEVTMSENPVEAMERGNELMVIIARSGKMKADAEYHLNSAQFSEVYKQLRKVIENMPGNISVKLQNSIVDNVCKDEKYLVSWCDRINRSATHQLDYIRTVISYAKSEMNNKL